MGMFDHYEPSGVATCPACHAELSLWQGKCGPRLLLEWRQGIEAPVGGPLEDECHIPADRLAGYRLPAVFEIHTSDENDHSISASGTSENGVWTSTRIDTVSSWQQRHDGNHVRVILWPPPERVTTRPDSELRCADSASAEVCDDCHLVDRLHEIEAACNPERPILVTIRAHEHELLLGLGLGTGQSVLQIQHDDGDGHCHVSIGDPTADGVTAFWLHGEHYTEIENRHLVPRDLARRITSAFIETADRSTLIDWEQLF